MKRRGFLGALGAVVAVPSVFKVAEPVAAPVGLDANATRQWYLGHSHQYPHQYPHFHAAEETFELYPTMIAGDAFRTRVRK